MSERNDGRGNIDRMTGHLVNQGMDPGKAKSIARDLQERKERRDDGRRDWRAPINHNGGR